MQYNEGKNYISKENAYKILRAFAKEYRKKHGEKIPAEIVIVGGGSLLLNYGFRDMTKDFDVIVSPFDEVKLLHQVEQYTLMDTDGLIDAYQKLKLEEDYTNKKLTEIDHDYPGAVTENTIDNIIADVRRNRRKGR